MISVIGHADYALFRISYACSRTSPQPGCNQPNVVPLDLSTDQSQNKHVKSDITSEDKVPVAQPEELRNKK